MSAPSPQSSPPVVSPTSFQVLRLKTHIISFLLSDLMSTQQTHWLYFQVVSSPESLHFWPPLRSLPSLSPPRSKTPSSLAWILPRFSSLVPLIVPVCPSVSGSQIMLVLFLSDPLAISQLAQSTTQSSCNSKHPAPPLPSQFCLLLPSIPVTGPC